MSNPIHLQTLGQPYTSDEQQPHRIWWSQANDLKNRNFLADTRECPSEIVPKLVHLL